MAETVSYEQAVWSWHRHLASGGSTPWREWVGRGPTADAGRWPPASESVPEGWSPPGAAQLELVRRVAARGELAGEDMHALAELVTGRSGPGRGLGQQPLSWHGGGSSGGSGGHRTGAPPVDPAEVPDEELVRVGAGALTELLLAAPESPAPPAVPQSPGPSEPESKPGRELMWMPRRRPVSPWHGRPAFQLAGAPITTSAVRRALAAAGHVEGGRMPQVVLLAEPFDRALAQVWSTRVQQGAAVRWHGFVRRWTGRRDLPPSVDLPELARGWAERVGPDAVHLVVAPAGCTAATTTVAEILGIDRRRDRPTGHAGHVPTGPLDLSPAAVDVIRRVNAVLGVRVPEERHVVVLARLVQLVAAGDRTAVPGSGPGAGLTVPAFARDWARERAEQMLRELTDGGYPVHGSAAGVLPRAGALSGAGPVAGPGAGAGAGPWLPAHPRRAEALEVVTACLVRAQLQSKER